MTELTQRNRLIAAVLILLSTTLIPIQLYYVPLLFIPPLYVSLIAPYLIIRLFQQGKKEFSLNDFFKIVLSFFYILAMWIIELIIMNHSYVMPPIWLKMMFGTIETGGGSSILIDMVKTAISVFFWILPLRLFVYAQLVLLWNFSFIKNRLLKNIALIWFSLFFIVIVYIF